MNKFIRLKELLVGYLDKYGEDGEINYLLNLVDYFINDQIEFDENVFYPVKEEVMIMSTFHKNEEFLEIVKAFDSLRDCIKSEMRQS